MQTTTEARINLRTCAGSAFLLLASFAPILAQSPDSRKKLNEARSNLRIAEEKSEKLQPVPRIALQKQIQAARSHCDAGEKALNKNNRGTGDREIDSCSRDSIKALAGAGVASKPEERREESKPVTNLQTQTSQRPPETTSLKCGGSELQYDAPGLGNMPANRYCYLISQTPMTTADAEKHCANQRSGLAGLPPNAPNPEVGRVYGPLQGKKLVFLNLQWGKTFEEKYRGAIVKGEGFEALQHDADKGWHSVPVGPTEPVYFACRRDLGPLARQ